MSDQTLASLGIKFATEGVDSSLSDMKRLLTGAENTYTGVATSRLILSQKTMTQIALEKEAMVKELADKISAAAKEVEIETEKQNKLKALRSGSGYLGALSNISSIADDGATRAAKQKELSDAKELREKVAEDHITAYMENMERDRIDLAEMAARKQATISDNLLFHEKANDNAYRNNKIAMYTEIFKAQDTNAKIIALQENLAATSIEIESNQARQYRDIEEKKVADELERTNKILAFRKAMEANSLEIISSNARQARAIQEKEELESIKEQDFHRQASLNSYRNDRISMYTQMFNEIDAKEKAAAEETKKRASETHGHLDRLMMRTASIVAAMGSYRIISAFVGVPEEILRTNIEMEKLRVLLEGVTGSVQNAKIEFDRLLALDIKTPFDIKGLTETFVMLKNYGLEPTEMVMKSLTDAVSKLGGGTEQLIGIGRQLGQAWAKDKLQQIDMRPMIENGLPVISLLADALHKTTAQILEMSKAGTIGREQMLLLFAEMQKDAPNAAARNMDTLHGALSNVVTAWTQFQDAILEDKSENALKRIFETWSSILFRWRDDISGVVNQTNAMAENLMKLENNRLDKNRIQSNPLLGEILSRFGLAKTYAEVVEKERDLLAEQDKILDAMEKESKAAYKLKETSESKLELDKKALELSEKQEKALIRQLEFEGKMAEARMATANAIIDSQIKDQQRLNTTKIAGFELERKQNEEAYSRNEISAKRRYDVEIDLIQKLKSAELQKLDEVEKLQKSKLTQQVVDVDKAFIAIKSIETNGQVGQVNRDTMAMGAGQALPSTLMKPGFGVEPFKPAVDENLKSLADQYRKIQTELNNLTNSGTSSKSLIDDKLKELEGQYNKLKDFATVHDAELTEWSEKYWKALVIHYGSVSEALQHYGENTEAYRAKFMKAYAEITGEKIKDLKLDDAAKDTADEKAKVIAKYAAQEVEARNKLVKSSYEYQRMLEEEQLKTIKITGTAKEYRDAELKYQEKYNVELQKALAIQDKVGEAIIRARMAAENQKPVYDLEKENDLIIQNEEAQSKFNEQLSKTRNLLDAGVISEDKFNEEMNRLAKSYNENFVEPAETYTKRMSQFAIQAARNMQSSFAQFLYDPFKNGLKGMLTGFIDMLRKMAAEAAAASIFDKLLGTKNAAGVSTGGLLEKIGVGIMSSFATGGDFGGGYRLVGEQGPEIEATGPSRIFNAQQTRDMLSKGSNTTVNNVTIQVQSAKGDNPSDVGSKAAEAFMRTIAKQEITNANRPGNQLNRTTTFGV